MGVERTIAMMQGRKTVYETELFAPLMELLATSTGKRMTDDEATGRALRVIADHIRSSVFIIGDEQGVVPSNLGQGYVLRRLIRRAVRYGKQLGLQEGFLKPLAESVIESYKHVYHELDRNRARIVDELAGEEAKFEKTLSRGMAELDKILEKMTQFGQTALSGKVVFRLYDTYGVPMEFTEEICRERGLAIDRQGFEKAFDAHKEISKQGADKLFKGGLVDNSQATTKLHTATHLLHKSLQTVLGDHVKQKGSNITAERLRFDFVHGEKMTEEQVKKVQEMVNDVIKRSLPVTMEVMTLEQAKDNGATALFAGKYGEQVKVYTIGDFSKEVCGGPHVNNTSELGKFRILKEESSSAGVRRIRAVLE
jgi:alanyl-tRNA synthetase